MPIFEVTITSNTWTRYRVEAPDKETIQDAYWDGSLELPDKGIVKEDGAGGDIDIDLYADQTTSAPWFTEFEEGEHAGTTDC